MAKIVQMRVTVYQSHPPHPCSHFTQLHIHPLILSSSTSLLISQRFILSNPSNTLHSRHNSTSFPSFPHSSPHPNQTEWNRTHKELGYPQYWNARWTGTKRLESILFAYCAMDYTPASKFRHVYCPGLQRTVDRMSVMASGRDISGFQSCFHDRRSGLYQG